MTVREDYLGIDHLALGMEADSRDNWVMFFRTVFGFLEHEQTLPDPYGLVRSLAVRSLAVRSPQGDIRLALNISQSRATQIARSGCSMPPAGRPGLPPCRSRPIMTICWRAGGELDVGSQRQQLLYDRDPQGRFPASLRPFTAGRSLS